MLQLQQQQLSGTAVAASGTERGGSSSSRSSGSKSSSSSDGHRTQDFVFKVLAGLPFGFGAVLEWVLQTQPTPSRSVARTVAPAIAASGPVVSASAGSVRQGAAGSLWQEHRLQQQQQRREQRRPLRQTAQLASAELSPLSNHRLQQAQQEQEQQQQPEPGIVASSVISVSIVSPGQGAAAAAASSSSTSYETVAGAASVGAAPAPAAAAAAVDLPFPVAAAGGGSSSSSSMFRVMHTSEVLEHLQQEAAAVARDSDGGVDEGTALHLLALHGMRVPEAVQAGLDRKRCSTASSSSSSSAGMGNSSSGGRGAPEQGASSGVGSSSSSSSAVSGSSSSSVGMGNGSSGGSGRPGQGASSGSSSSSSSAVSGSSSSSGSRSSCDGWKVSTATEQNSPGRLIASSSPPQHKAAPARKAAYGVRGSSQHKGHMGELSTSSDHLGICSQLSPLQDQKSWGLGSRSSSRGGHSGCSCSSSSRNHGHFAGLSISMEAGEESIAEAAAAVGAVCSITAAPRLPSPAAKGRVTPGDAGAWLHPWDALPDVPKSPKPSAAAVAAAVASPRSLRPQPAAAVAAAAAVVTPVCQVCLEPVEKLQLNIDLGCNHLTCDECWRGVLRACLDLGSVRGARCPAEGCGRGLSLPAAQALMKDKVGTCKGTQQASV